ncbi:hypothetical protein ACFOEW_15605 [Alteromonas oceani]|uniref:Uncharacterized protein n=1 Tax=Alteromonas oceani TaxID=2071609 RepID=A0ABV7K1M5_9ALTE|nr:hypothetical protein [Alteromonas oceani]
MELKEFIKTALSEIIEAVSEASDHAAQHEAKIGSTQMQGYLKEAKATWDENGHAISQVDFDIALTEGNKSNTKGGIGVHLGAVKLGTDGSSQNENSSLSRIKFSVPVVFSPSKS